MGQDPPTENGSEATVRETLSLVMGARSHPTIRSCRTTNGTGTRSSTSTSCFALEDALSIRFDAAEIGELTNVASIVDLAERHMRLAPK